MAPIVPVDGIRTDAFEIAFACLDDGFISGEVGIGHDAFVVRVWGDDRAIRGVLQRRGNGDFHCLPRRDDVDGIVVYGDGLDLLIGQVGTCFRILRQFFCYVADENRVFVEGGIEDDALTFEAHDEIGAM